MSEEVECRKCHRFVLEIEAVEGNWQIDSASTPGFLGVRMALCPKCAKTEAEMKDLFSSLSFLEIGSK